MTVSAGRDQLDAILDGALDALRRDGEATIAIPESVAEQGIPVTIRFVAEYDDPEYPDYEHSPQVDLRMGVR